MTTIKTTAIILASMLAGGAFQVSAYEMTLTPGTFADRMAAESASFGKRLVLRGEAYASDLISLKYLPPTVTDFDMSGLIVKGNSLGRDDYYGQRVFADGELPAFMLLGSAVKTVALPASTTRIGEAAFAGSALTEISIPAVTSMGRSVFSGCKALASVDMSTAAISEIPEKTFNGCRSLSEVSLPGITKVGAYAFCGTALTSMRLDMAREIGEYAFASSPELQTVFFPADCRVGEGAFFGDSSLADVNNAGLLSPITFALSGISQVYGRVASEHVPDGAFASTPLVSVALGSGVRSVGSRAFASLGALREINVFDCGEAIPSASPDAFEGVDAPSVTLVVKAGTEDKWRAAPVWREFKVEGSVSSRVDAALMDITVSRRGNRVVATASVPIDDMSVFGLDGVALARATASGATTVELEVAPGKPVLVSVAAGGAIKVTKLL